MSDRRSGTTAPANYCPRCSLWRDGGPCDHNPEASCLNACGRQRGFRWLGDDRAEVKPRTRCWTCWAVGMGLIQAPAHQSPAAT